MAKDKLTDYDSTAANNLDVGGISVAEGMLPSAVNNAIRELMSHQAEAFGAGTPLYVDQTNNRVGINQASPSHPIHAGTSDLILDASGNLLVGTTSNTIYSSSSEAGSQIGDGYIATARAATVAYLNRITTDGSIVEFRKSGTTVGSIASTSDDLHIYSSTSGHSGLRFASGYVGPTNNTGTSTDNAFDLGVGAYRWDDIYATNGTIQTSDANEKQQIASLSDAEMTAAKAISALFKTFKWNDSVAEKGDAARTHTGVIAQDVQQAMTAAGLDAGNYAFFISSTWWEADEDYTDDDGNAQTRTVTYDTQAEAPEGATERTRLGIRYPELLAFIGAATEQRLADIETRLTALENA